MNTFSNAPEAGPAQLIRCAALFVLASCSALSVYGQAYSPLYVPSSSNGLQAGCTDQYGNLYANCPLTFYVGYYAGTNAHTHYASPPPASTVTASCTTGGGGTCPITLTTGIVGEAEAIVTTAPSGRQTVFDYAVGYTIYYVSDHGIWTLNGAKTNHGNSTAYNHWMATYPADKLYNATVRYQAVYPGLVLANDMSLPFGGIFDIAGNWAPDHTAHRTGKDSDINGIYGSAATYFLSMCTAEYATYVVEHEPGNLHCGWN